MTKFVIDKNIIKGLDSPQSSMIIELLMSIKNKCHKILCNKEILYKRYYKIIDKEAKSPSRDRIRWIISMISNKFEHMEIEYDNPRLIELGVKDEDIPFASLAIKDDAILITEDAPLRDAIKDYCQCLTIEEALEYVRKHD